MLEKDITEALAGVSFLVGNKETVGKMPDIPALEPFAAEMLDMLNDVSRSLMMDREAKQYPDVVTYAFWIRKSGSSLKVGDRH